MPRQEQKKEKDGDEVRRRPRNKQEALARVIEQDPERAAKILREILHNKL